MIDGAFFAEHPQLARRIAAAKFARRAANAMLAALARLSVPISVERTRFMTLPELIQLIQDGDTLLGTANTSAAASTTRQQAVVDAQTAAAHAAQVASDDAVAVAAKKAQIDAAVAAYFQVGAPQPPPGPAPAPPA